jgi:hypothetical protein
MIADAFREPQFGRRPQARGEIESGFHDSLGV